LEKGQYTSVLGCDSLFIDNTLTKNGMKVLFQEHLVSSPPGFPATITTDFEKEVENNGMVFPLFVKISDSYGSVGLDDDSVCHTMDHLKAKCAKLFEEFPHLTVEEFIDGPEFSVIIIGCLMV
jgi:biotin carboxylase